MKELESWWATSDEQHRGASAPYFAPELQAMPDEEKLFYRMVC